MTRPGRVASFRSALSEERSYTSGVGSKGERGEGADTHAGCGDRPAGYHGLGGPIDNGYGVIVLNGEVTVTGRSGKVALKQGQGTMLFNDGKAAWPAGRMKRAVALNHVRKSAGST
jgi:hypothetical protein